MITKNIVLFRFSVLFVGLWLFPFPISFFYGFFFDGSLHHEIYKDIIPFIGEHILKLENPISTQSNGSGDRTYNYIVLLLQLFLAILGTTIWTIIDRENRSYEKLNYWFLVLIRYSLAYSLIVYGLGKIIQLQFPEPSLLRLLQPYGSSSPMGLAWTFFGYSEGYNLLIGLLEFIPGILLLHRKTKLLGAFLAIPVIGNIVAVNFFFDVPVKIYSTQLLCQAIIISSPDLKRFVSFVFNKPIDPLPEFEPFKSYKWKLVKTILKWSFVIVLLFTTINQTVESNEQYGPDADRPFLYGTYEVKNFVLNRDTIPRSTGSESRWKYFYFSKYEGYGGIVKMDDSKIRFTSEIDTIENRFSIAEFDEPETNYNFTYIKYDSILIIEGLFKSDTISCHTTKIDKGDFLLTSRGFNWINEAPFNR